MGLFDRFIKNKSSSEEPSVAVSSTSNASHNFKYLDNLIHSGSKEIVLESDIVLDSSEQSTYGEGINVDVDGIVIDGNGHTIDAANRARIFNVDAREVTIKNVTFSNGYSDFVGGAIFNEENCHLKISSSRFVNNSADQSGGAIVNLGEIDIVDSKFESNNTKNIAGAISNQPSGVLKVQNVDFISNIANVDAGAIGNYGQLFLIDSKLESNRCKNEGGAINNQRSGEIKIDGTLFIRNVSEFNGGAIICFGNVDMIDSRFESNHANSEGGAINSLFGVKNIKNCKFTSNSADKGGGAIMAFDEIIISSCDFDANSASKLGGAINVQPQASINGDNLKFINNMATYGGAIFNFGNVILSNSKLGSNKSMGEGGAIINQGTLSIDSSDFNANIAQTTGASIFNGKEAKVTNSSFSNHNTNVDMIFNDNMLNSIDNAFKDNKSKNIIFNNDDSNLTVIGTDFIRNHSMTSAIYNKGKSCGIVRTTFEDNTSDGESCADIYNLTEIDLQDCKFINDTRTVYNEGHIDLK